MANSKPESRLIKAAGAVAWRPGPDGRPEILLVHRRKYDDWSLPKGKVEPGEPLPVTAVREVLEEGGARLALGRRLNSVRYNVGGRPKRVHYWSASVASLDDRAVPNDEVDEIEWVDADRAVERISYHHDHGVLADFARLPGADRPGHPAPARQGGGQVELEARRRPPPARRRRPGRRQGPGRAARVLRPPRPAHHLARRPLRGNPPPVRGAVRRRAAGRAVPPHSPPSHPERTRPTLTRPLPPSDREAIAAGEPTIICAHRENIPVLQAAALAALGLAPARLRRRPRQRPGRRPACVAPHSPSSPRSGTTPSPPPASGS